MNPVLVAPQDPRPRNLSPAPDGEGTVSVAHPSRTSAKCVIRDLIRRHERAAAHLQTLHDMLPTAPTPEQDEAVWQLVIKMERA